ncbi:primosomal protein N' [Proteiniclasticum sp.]|uniref:primosomal protein N' n=1 Tax=Proteiniclasticum sp. TaxID=2053595 RepID=UPI0028974C7B|nr:primosomal protein N' [Proteiniclasticum sp.]
MSFAGIIVNNEALAMDMIFTYKVPEAMEVSVGQRVKVSFGQGNKKIDGFVLKITENVPENIKRIKEIHSVYPEIYFDEDKVDFIEEIRRRYLSTYLDAIKLLIPRGILNGMKYKVSEKLYHIKEADGRYEKEPYLGILDLVKKNQGNFIKADISKLGFSLSSVNTLIKHGYLTVMSENDYRYNVDEFEDYKAKNLNKEQSYGVEKISSALGTYLLHGITGSGKTEVFLELIRRNIEKGYDSIVLLPEISLTPQMIERFKGRFGKDITIFHSRLSDGERYDEWHRVRSGKVKIAIGARSALFLPFKNLKLVVIDEEHESTYKSEMSPKYNAKEIAEYMMKRNEGQLILASATPSVESFHRAENKEIELITLSERATSASLPQMDVVDMRDELLSGNRSIFSNRLMQKITETLERKEQIILFLNRRGFSTFVSCRACGFVFKCENCDISMTHHRDNSLMCHQCGARKYLPKTCPSCQSKYIKQFGTGTEKVEAAIRQAFPSARVMRMDRDTTKQKSSYETMYNDFKNNECDILIGTQMISKGLDFKDVTLVGILAADLSLNLPDYRAAEKTFQLITQVAGRAGRGDKPGEVIIQTYSPENFAVLSAKSHDYMGFYRREIQMREVLKNPPFSKLLYLVFSSEDEQLLIKNTQYLGGLLRKHLTKYDNMILLGPGPCIISKIKNSYRWQVLIKGDIKEETALEIRNLIHDEMKNLYKEIKVSMDINPNSMM